MAFTFELTGDVKWNFTDGGKTRIKKVVLCIWEDIKRPVTFNLVNFDKSAL